MSYKITIIIPIYNIETYLEETLNSLLNQSIGIENLEIIMVNDNSTDDSGKIIDNFAEKYENFVAIHLSKNSGLPGKPRNIGIEKSTGEYLMFMDHDDYYKQDACEIFYKKINKEKADVLSSRYLKVFENGKTEKSHDHFKNIDEIKINRIDEEKKLLNMDPAIWTRMFKRTFIMENNIRFPEGVLAEDLSFMVESNLKANGIIHLNNYFSYNYRIRNSENNKSTIHIRNKKYLMAMIEGYYNTYNILKDQNSEKYLNIILEEHLKAWVMAHFIFSNISKSEKKELLMKIAPLFEKLGTSNLNLNKIYLPLFNNIIQKNFDEAILNSEILAYFLKREQNYNKQLTTKKKQIANLQTTKGYLEYKTKNIDQRVKKKFKKQ